MPGVTLQLGDGCVLGPALHREEAQVGLVTLVVPQDLRRALGASRLRGREQAAAQVGEEEGVDQLRLAPYRLPNHGDGEAIPSDDVQGGLEPLAGAGGGAPVILQPALQLQQGLGHPRLPLQVLAETLLEGWDLHAL